MKMLAFLFAAVVAVSFASCGNKTEQSACCADSDTVCVEEVVEPVDTTAADTVAVDTVAAPVAE